MAHAIKVTTFTPYSIAFLIFITITVNAELLGIGTCPIFTTTAGTLDGTWYEVLKIHSLTQSSLRCITYDFQAPDENNIATFKITGIFKLTGRRYELNGQATTVASSTGKYSVKFPSHPNLLPRNFNVLGYEAGKWIVLASCTNYGIFHILNVAILTVARFPPNALLEAAIAVIEGNGLPVNLLKEVEQTLC